MQPHTAFTLTFVIAVWVLCLAASKRQATAGHAFTIGMLGPYLVQSSEAFGWPSRLIAYALFDAVAVISMLVVYVDLFNSPAWRRYAIIGGALALVVGIISHVLVLFGVVGVVPHAICVTAAAFIATLAMGFTSGAVVIHNVLKADNRRNNLADS